VAERLTVLTVGTFDTPHLGHYQLMRQIKGLFPQSRLVVGVNQDDFIERFKGKKPLFCYQERAEAIGLIDLVDEVLPNTGGEDSTQLIRRVKPNVIAIGSDWLRRDYCKQMNFTPEYLEVKRIALVYIPRYTDISSTLIKSRMHD
jgi:glycerol-3-phosphate cytidylyltransferase